MTEPDEEAVPRPRMSARHIETWVDQAIQAAQRRGDFDDLPGAGRPLPGLDRPHDPDWWVKGMIERERLDLTDAMPGVMALRRERQGYPESLAGLIDEATVRAWLEDFNERVLADRRKPYFGKGSPMVAGRVDVEEMVDRWRQLRAGMPGGQPGTRVAGQPGSPKGGGQQDDGSAEPRPAAPEPHTWRWRRWWRRG